MVRRRKTAVLKTLLDRKNEEIEKIRCSDIVTEKEKILRID